MEESDTHAYAKVLCVEATDGVRLQVGQNQN